MTDPQLYGNFPEWPEWHESRLFRCPECQAVKRSLAARIACVTGHELAEMTPVVGEALVCDTLGVRTRVLG